MIFAITFVLLAILRVPSSLGGPTPATNDGDATSFHTNITRTVDGETIVLTDVTCPSTAVDCHWWCSIIPVDSSVTSACHRDCVESYCMFPSAMVEFPANSGLFISPSKLVQRAREEDLQQLYAAHGLTFYPPSIAVSDANHSSSSSLPRRDLASCFLACVAFDHLASLIPFRIARNLGYRLARHACPAMCIEIWVTRPNIPPRIRGEFDSLL